MPEDASIVNELTGSSSSNLLVWFSSVRRRPIDWAADAGLFVGTPRFHRMR
jgi:hypothetical protein